MTRRKPRATRGRSGCRAPGAARLAGDPFGGPALERFGVVQIADRVDHQLDAEAVVDKLVAAVRDHVGQGMVRQQSDDARGQCIAIVRLDQQPADAVFDHLRDSAHPGRNDRAAECHRLEHAEPLRFAIRWQDGNIEGGGHGRNVLAPAREDDAFFDICDRNGIMVWQDFAMACAVYPQTPEFLEVMRQEAFSVVRKLRNHPSLALWSGDNEVDEFYFFAGLDPARNQITREVLPQVLSQADPYRPYLPSSPYMSPEVIATGQMSLMPENHLWGPRDYFKSAYYTEHTAHFVSEIGYHGCPSLSSIKRFVDEQHLWPWQNNTQWVFHSADTTGNPYRINLMANQVKELFGAVPDKMEDFIQILLQSLTTPKAEST